MRAGRRLLVGCYQEISRRSGGMGVSCLFGPVVFAVDLDVSNRDFTEIAGITVAWGFTAQSLALGMSLWNHLPAERERLRLPRRQPFIVAPHTPGPSPPPRSCRS